MQAERSAYRNQEFVIHLAGLLSCPLQNMRSDINTVALLLSVDLHVVRLDRSSHHNLIAASGLDRNRAILRVHGNVRVRANRKTVFLFRVALILGEGRRCETRRKDQCRKHARINAGLVDILLPKPPMTRHKATPLRPDSPVRLFLIEYDPTQSDKEVPFVDKLPSGAAARRCHLDSDLRRPAIPGCLHSRLAIAFHRSPSSQVRAMILHSETAHHRRSVPLLPTQFASGRSGLNLGQARRPWQPSKKRQALAQAKPTEQKTTGELNLKL